MTPTQQAAVLAGLEAIRAEVRRATEKHPREYQSAHEAYGILKEEVDELWDAIRRMILFMPGWKPRRSGRSSSDSWPRTSAPPAGTADTRWPITAANASSLQPQPTNNTKWMLNRNQTWNPDRRRVSSRALFGRGGLMSLSAGINPGATTSAQKARRRGTRIAGSGNSECSDAATA